MFEALPQLYSPIRVTRLHKCPVTATAHRLIALALVSACRSDYLLNHRPSINSAGAVSLWIVVHAVFIHIVGLAYLGSLHNKPGQAGA